MTDIQIITTDDLRADDKEGVDELVADVRVTLSSILREIDMLRDGLAAEDDPEDEGLAAVADLVQIDRLTRLRSVLQTALADLPD